MNKNQMIGKNLFLSACFIFALFYMGGTATAQETISLDVSRSFCFSAGEEITRVAVADPELADVTVISKRELLVLARKPGTTTLYVWTNDGMRQEYAINVTNQDTQTAAAVKTMIGYAGIMVEKVGDKILLEGSVQNQLQKNRAQKIAEMYSEKVINLLEMTRPDQVRLEAKILEISTDKVKKLGIQYANASDIDTEKGIVTIGPTGIFGFGQTFSNSRDSSNAKTGGYADINATLQALVTSGDAKVLSQPSMVTMSGEKANILIGGEMPIPMSNSEGQLTVEWREYGIKLNIEPVVDTDQSITSKVSAEVSTLDSSSAAAINLSSGLSIPALRSRKAETVIQLPSGSTMAIGGLITSEEGRQITKVPFLGDLPIIGQFFRSTATSKEKKEIIILVTPTLVDETTPAGMSEEMEALLESRQPEGAKTETKNN
ncbi:pilus assembly protein CpaC [Dendrosporobacter quercicolus]|uniref:Pilus assembly protein CpaC n=1 Tax=Dendrosporobacter quercicolus TaxID=146817 RepID=A0A1H0A1J9_9FIRM|nr:pilus assembly protein N-terminal domain-containing protein [Dendrosporobacter quercicolus]SDN27579.1 pilus assembly protein CpaC [Dendrosporobacter quercicolus]